jgi:acyl-[acyl-carrier-protein] desaturase
MRTTHHGTRSVASQAQPSATVEAVVAEIQAFEMPGAGTRDFRRKAAEMALAGIFDLRIHRDEVVMRLVRRRRILELQDLSHEAEQARVELASFLDETDVSARRLEERREPRHDRIARG